MVKEKKRKTSDALERTLKNDLTKKISQKKSVIENVGKVVSLIISILSLYVAVRIGSVANDISLRNQPIELDPTTIMLDESEEFFFISIKELVATQGGVKKAYIAYEVDNNIIYDEVIDHIEVPKSEINLKKIKIATIEDGEFEYYLKDYDAKVYDIVSFGLVIQDYSDNWNLFLILVQPAITFPGITHSASGIDPYGETASQTVCAAYTAEQKACIVDTCLINESTLQKKVREFTTDVTKEAKWDEKTKSILSQTTTPAGGKIAITNSKFAFDITYPEQDVSHIMQLIDRIYTDFR